MSKRYTKICNIRNGCLPGRRRIMPVTVPAFDFMDSALAQFAKSGYNER
ncbi:MAG: hypothetical protein NC347_11505 [Clostridium sp.]|nr:hypothetical protein [Clostridium sp.]